jgi:hypothetical protein
MRLSRLPTASAALYPWYRRRESRVAPAGQARGKALS